jgi:hypothetical protein
VKGEWELLHRPLRASAASAESIHAPRPSTADNMMLSARDFGALGDFVTDDTAALQRAIDTAQRESKALYVPGGSYMLSSPLHVRCVNEMCSDSFHLPHNRTFLHMYGAGAGQTHFFPAKNRSHLLCLLDMSAEDPENASRTSTGFNSGHVISDLHLAGGVSDGWMQVQGWPNDRHADYGIYGRNLIASNFLRVSARARPFRV